jgi:hypothetical protein
MANECVSIDEADSVFAVNVRAHKQPTKNRSGQGRRPSGLREIDEMCLDRQQFNRFGWLEGDAA